MPEWINDAVFYEIYPQSFNDTNADGIGDLQGVIEKLDYIRELGCDAIWLNPCFESPFHDAGYDVSDYRKIAPRYGTNEDMRRLFASAHERGMHVLLDLVAGHTSIEHEWFARSMKNDEEYADRYIWADAPFEKFEGTEEISGYINGICERGSCAANFYSTQPALNYGFAKTDKPWQISTEHPAAQATFQAMTDVMRFWLDMGCDGFRVDMAGSLVKNDEGQEQTIKLWQKFRRTLEREYPDAALISEWGHPERALRAGFHMDFLLHFGPSHYLDLFRENPFFHKSGKGDISPFVKTYEEMLEGVSEGLVCIPSSNHDMPRISRHLDTDDLKLAFAFLLSMPGAPFIYYGDEIGMKYLEGLPSVEGAFERTGSRTPMQWDSSLNAGFSSAKQEELYIAIDPDPQRPNVKAQMEDPDSLWREIQKLIAIRRKYPALQNSSGIEFLYAESETYPLAYRRGEGNEAIIAVFNPSGKEAVWETETDKFKEILYFLGKKIEVADGKIIAPACSAAFLSLRDGAK